LFLAGIVGTAAITAVGSATYDVTFATDLSSDATESVTVQASAPVPNRFLEHVVEAEGATVTGTREAVSTLFVTVAVSSDRTATVTRASVTVVPYLAVLPRGVLVDLHAIHPVVAVGATILAAFGPLYLLYRLTLAAERLARRLTESDRDRTRERSR
jgi:hypothetical protein